MPDSASLVSDRIFPRCHSRETCEASTLGSLLLPKPPVGPSSPLESPSRPWSQITERAVVERPTQVGTALHQLRELGGPPRALDDFGTGQSALAYLHQFPVEVDAYCRGFAQRPREARRCGSLSGYQPPRGPPPAASAYWTDFAAQMAAFWPEEPTVGRTPVTNRSSTDRNRPYRERLLLVEPPGPGPAASVSGPPSTAALASHAT